MNYEYLNLLLVDLCCPTFSWLGRGEPHFKIWPMGHSKMEGSAKDNKKAPKMSDENNKKKK